MKKALVLLCAILLMGCGAENEYSSWDCFFSYDNSIHLDQTLSSATNPAIPGIFCKITERSQGGTKYLVFENNLEASSEQRETAEELGKYLRLGLNNGIIVGVQNYGSFTAYDLQCPNCVRRENNMINPNYRLTLDTKGSGIATCSKCGNRYDLNSGGMVVKGEKGDKGLERYRNAKTSGPNGFITVSSK